MPSTPIPPHDDPSQAWSWALGRRIGSDRSYAMLSCKTATSAMKVLLKSHLALNAMKDIAVGLSMNSPSAIAAEIAGRRQIIRALQIYRTDQWLVRHDDYESRTAHERLAAMDYVHSRIAALEPLPLPARVARVPALEAEAQTHLVAHCAEPPRGAPQRHHYRVEILENATPRRVIDVDAADARRAGSAALGITCAELQNLMVFLVRRDPEPARLAWADALLRYVPALPARSRHQVIDMLAGAT